MGMYMEYGFDLYVYPPRESTTSFTRTQLKL